MPTNKGAKRKADSDQPSLNTRPKRQRNAVQPTGSAESPTAKTSKKTNVKGKGKVIRTRESTEEPPHGLESTEIFYATRSKVVTERDRVLADWKTNNPNVCCVCLNVDTRSDPLFCCAAPECAVVVHRNCYGVSSRPPSPWLCDRCRATDPAIVTCVLCPEKEGALKRVGDTDKWAHVVCVWWIEDTEFDENTVANIELEHIHPRGWAMECSICPSPDEAKFGCKINCESHGCKKAVHATCANDLGLLEEAKDDDDMANPYFTHCKQHGAGGDPQLNKWARWVRQKHKLLSRLPSTSTPSPETILRKRNDPRTFLEDAYVDMKSRQEGEIRTLLHDIAKLEAELADTEIELPKAEEEVERLEEDIKTGRHDVVKNREATESLRKNLVAVKGAFKGLPDGLDDGLRTKIIEMFVQGGDSLVLDPEHAAAFFDVYEDTIKNAPKRVESRNRRMRKSSSPPASASGRKLKQAAPTESRHHPYAKLAEKKEQSPAAPPSNRMNVVVGLCSICKTFESSPGGGGGAKAEEGVNGGSSGGGGKRGVGANRLAQCVECERLYHFGCLDPPLVKPLPRGFAWRCKECDASSEDEERGEEGDETDGIKKEGTDGLVVPDDTPIAKRRTKRRSDAPERLGEYVIH